MGEAIRSRRHGWRSALLVLLVVTLLATGGLVVLDRLLVSRGVQPGPAGLTRVRSWRLPFFQVILTTLPNGQNALEIGFGIRSSGSSLPGPVATSTAPKGGGR